jgi:hypothetical protein
MGPIGRMGEDWRWEIEDGAQLNSPPMRIQRGNLYKVELAIGALPGVARQTRQPPGFREATPLALVQGQAGIGSTVKARESDGNG